jgi:hypothetical protein
MRKKLLVAAALAAVLIAAGTLPKLTLQPKTHIGGKTSSLVSLFAAAGPGETAALDRMMPDGSLGTFALPAGSVLVVTDMLVTTNGSPSAGLTRGGLDTGVLGGVSNPYYSFDATKQAHVEIHLTGGATWTTMPSLLTAADSSNSVFVQVYGYLATDK